MLSMQRIKKAVVLKHLHALKPISNLRPKTNFYFERTNAKISKVRRHL